MFRALPRPKENPATVRLRAVPGICGCFEMVEAEGLEPTAQPSKIKGIARGWTPEWTLPPELREIIAKWERLPESLRAAMLAIARAKDGSAEQEGGRGRKRPQARADRSEGGQA